MKNSKDRILTTHAGSLIRPPEIIPLLEEYCYDDFQMLADMGRIDKTGNADGLQLLPRPDAGQQQQMR